MQTWQLQSGQEFTLKFDRFDILHCKRLNNSYFVDGQWIHSNESKWCYCDYVEISDGSTTQRYCGPDNYGDYYSGNGEVYTSIPGPFTSTGTITVKFISGGFNGEESTGFLAVVCCSVIITDLTTIGRLTNTVNLWGWERFRRHQSFNI